MKILYIAPGNSIHSKKWIEKIKSLYPKNNYFWYSFEKFEYKIDQEIITFSNSVNKRFRLFAILTSILQIGIIHKKQKFDLIHIHSIGTYGTFALIPILFNTVFILTPWGSDIIFGSKKYINKIIMKVIFWKASLITCDAKHVTDLILKISPKAKPKIINFGIDTNFFKLKEKVFSKDNKIKIISTRNHESIYNLETLLEASKYLKDNNINFSLTIAGYGSETEYLIRKMKELGLSDFIEFTGRYEYQKLPELLSKYDFYISTSLSDAGLASSIAEAMACQNIVIVSDSADNNLWITNSVNGFLFRSGSPKSLYKSIISAIDKKNIWDQISFNARKTIIYRNDITNEMRKMYRLMELI